MAERPTFLSIICILLTLYGLLVLLLGILCIAMEETIKDILADIVDFGDLTTAIGVIAIIIGLLVLAVAYFMWKGMGIGWYLAMIFLVINAIDGILSFPIGVIMLLITIALIYYFMRENVRRYFGT
ncbi:MAG: hypothetical protein FWH44_05350 [Methanomassiliicoccaceae archaeon]|nr:hypothetical protein [Methanomassiliicoccaceae archaeon]